ncbi:cob(I)yrinic acid a,c-diamide adenosyltransferase [Bacillus subtilis]|uniref:cob(I)yrinic acid a,c-diamide adenosyltransferase n=1 Tax=Pseudochrobactrum asaccharolyticum TaxID=354351 RepID=UPI001F01B1CB|nr:cob(I)yrinic acid a,c-diamide adenosyltransferase [Pseudochrobactrum asaccharolyticum]MCF7644751.1 cob(I)yrinic acid a,c-diamide adenosyltransferase [Pseudochrobactrum asaccharolyticum]MCF7670010.1 cob(I)yrinic acid a,c-diamide adenosyltransferase [Bacillus subtilis]
MVKLNKIYTRTGDDGTTGLACGPRRRKDDMRIVACGDIDELNASIGLARLYTTLILPEVDAILTRVQNDLFDLGADIATPAVIPLSSGDTGESLGYEPLRIISAQVDRLEKEIDALNAQLEPLRSFILPGGSPAAAHLHMARTIARRAERSMVALAAQDGEIVSDPALHYINRLSDLLFVAARIANNQGQDDILWVPALTR